MVVQKETELAGNPQSKRLPATDQRLALTTFDKTVRTAKRLCAALSKLYAGFLVLIPFGILAKANFEWWGDPHRHYGFQQVYWGTLFLFILILGLSYLIAQIIRRIVSRPPRVSFDERMASTPAYRLWVRSCLLVVWFYPSALLAWILVDIPQEALRGEFDKHLLLTLSGPVLWFLLAGVWITGQTIALDSLRHTQHAAIVWKWWIEILGQGILKWAAALILLVLGASIVFWVIHAFGFFNVAVVSLLLCILAALLRIGDKLQR